MPDDLADLVNRWQDDGKLVRRRLADEGPGLVARLCATTGSLQKLSLRTGLSPAYLSRVRAGAFAVSPGAYLRLAEVETGEPDPT